MRIPIITIIPNIAHAPNIAYSLNPAYVPAILPIAEQINIIKKVNFAFMRYTP
jgi:hypothetical protein